MSDGNGPPFDSTQGVAYEGACPRCGNDLDAPDDNLDRHCHACAITVRHATATFEVIPDAG